MLTDQWQGYTGLPDYSDPGTIATYLQNLFNFVGARAVPRYTTVAARDAELSSPADGQLAWVTSGSTLYIRAAGAWQVAWQPEDTWKPLTLTNGWTNAVAGSARYRKDRAGNVHVQGRLNSGTSGTGQSAAAFTLPTGYRHTNPTFLRLPCGTNQLSTGAEAYFYPTGEVAISHDNGTGSGYVSINQVLSTL